MGKIVAVDYGKKRTGLAVADPVLRIPMPWYVVHTVGDPDTDAATVRQTLADSHEDIDTLVVGIPYNMDGSAGPQAELTRRFANKLSVLTNLPVEFCDERLSSYHAEQKFRPPAEKTPPRKRKLRKKSDKPLDAVAAAVILQTYLAQNR